MHLICFFHTIYVFKCRHFKDRALCNIFYSENNALNQIWPNKTYDKKNSCWVVSSQTFFYFIQKWSSSTVLCEDSRLQSTTRSSRWLLQTDLSIIRLPIKIASLLSDSRFGVELDTFTFIISRFVLCLRLIFIFYSTSIPRLTNRSVFLQTNWLSLSVLFRTLSTSSSRSATSTMIQTCKISNLVLIL